MRHITNREKQILQLVADGMVNKQIAEELGIALQTIKTHRLSVMRRLDANSTAHAIAICLRRGWLE